jgi:hypothetical protein
MIHSLQLIVCIEHLPLFFFRFISKQIKPRHIPLLRRFGLNKFNHENQIV